MSRPTAYPSTIRAALRRGGVVVALAVLAFLAAPVASAQDLPTPTGKVNDFANVLPAPDRTTLEAQLADLERTTSVEVAIVTVPSLDGRTIENYATALFNTWGIGKKGRDNGVLILVSIQDRTMRIEVGYGLEGVLPDGLAGSVIRELFRPKFRNGDYRGGIVDGTTRIIDIVRRNETLTAEQRAALDQAAREAGKSWGMAAFLGLFVAIGAFISGSGIGARVIVQSVVGLVFTVGPLAASGTVAPTAAVVVLVLVGVAVFAWAVRVGRRPEWQEKFRGRTSRTGWVMSGAGRRSSSGGSSRSGGSSFGGGRSGGGGASGRW
ncbi:MAG: YgcG family protein [Vicinamibacterales bacterium]